MLVNWFFPDHSSFVQESFSFLHLLSESQHKVISQCFVQSGDIINNNGTGGESIYDDVFDIENYKLQHTKEGLIGMSTISGTNSVNSQFYITSAPCEHLDGTNIVFGTVRKGLDIIKEMATVERINDHPVQDILITDCGELKKGQPWNIHIVDETEDMYPPWPNDWEEGNDSTGIEKAITTIRESGNFYFLKKNYSSSQNKYLKTLRYIDWYLKSGKYSDNVFIDNCKFRTLLNLAAVNLKSKKYKEALHYCNQCETIDANNGKVYYRRAQAKLGLRDIDEALDDLRKAMSLLPNDKSIQNILKIAKSDKLLHLKKEREFFRRVFK